MQSPAELDTKPILFRLTLRELEAATCLWTSWLLTLYLTCITCQEAVVLQILLILFVNLHQCACNGEAQSLRLTGEATAVQIGLDVILLCCLQQLQRLLYDILKYC